MVRALEDVRLRQWAQREVVPQELRGIDPCVGAHWGLIEPIARVRDCTGA